MSESFIHRCEFEGEYRRMPKLVVRIKPISQLVRNLKLSKTSTLKGPRLRWLRE